MGRQTETQKDLQQHGGPMQQPLLKGCKTMV